MSIGAVKAVEIGDGINVTHLTGSEDNDGFVQKNGIISKTSNHAGGIMGGMSDGSDIILRAHIKPTPVSYTHLKSTMKLKADIILPCMALGSSLFVMQLSESVISVCYNSSLLKYGGDVAVGAMTILTSVMQFAMLPLQGLGQGAQPIISYNSVSYTHLQSRRQVLHSCFLCLNGQEKPPSNYHGGSDRADVLHSHWRDVHGLPESSV